MKRLLFIFLAALMFAAAAQAQDDGVGSEYVKSDKSTRVYTASLYAVNTPEQFLEIQLEAWYKGEKLATPPAKVTLAVYSFSKKPIFEKQKRTLVVAHDGGELKVGEFSEVLLKGTTLKGVDTFFPEDGTADNGIQIPVPTSAVVKAGGKVDGLVMEMMNLTMKTDQFMQFAKSSKMELRIGTASLPLNELQVQIMHRFADRITPPPAQ